MNTDSFDESTRLISGTFRTVRNRPLHFCKANGRSLLIARFEIVVIGLSLGRSRFGLQRVLRELDQFIERGHICRGDVRQHFAVERAFGGFQTFHETAVGRAGFARGGIDADLPERAESALLEEIGVRIDASLGQLRQPHV